MRWFSILWSFPKCFEYETVRTRIDCRPTIACNWIPLNRSWLVFSYLLFNAYSFSPDTADSVCGLTAVSFGVELNNDVRGQKFLVREK